MGDGSDHILHKSKIGTNLWKVGRIGINAHKECNRGSNGHSTMHLIHAHTTESAFHHSPCLWPLPALGMNFTRGTYNEGGNKQTFRNSYTSAFLSYVDVPGTNPLSFSLITG